MGSSRLPGKTLLPFGGQSLLSHIVERIEQGGIARGDVCVATSYNSEDEQISAAAAELGCDSHAGSPSDVSRRILGAANGATGFLLVLGDNPWVDPSQITEILNIVRTNDHMDYVVSATQELSKSNWPKRLYPIGTRLQYVNTAFMAERLEELDNAEVREHTSKLFDRIPKQSSLQVLVPDDGWSAERLDMLNISINTASDYNLALKVLDSVGLRASCAEITKTYLTIRGAS